MQQARAQVARCTGCTKCIQGVRSAGVLIVDTSRQELILVKDQRSTYNDAGGILDKKKHRSAQQCAEEELREETRDLIRVCLTACPYMDLNCGPGHKYRMYILYVNGPGLPQVSCRQFYKIDASKLPKAYQETTRMTRFPILQFKKERLAQPNGKGQITASKLTDQGLVETLDGRVLKGIAIAITNNLI